MRYYVTLGPSSGPSQGGDEVAIDVVQRPGGETEVTVDGERVSVDVVEAEGALNVRVGDRVFDLWLEGDGDQLEFVTGAARGKAVVQSERKRVGSRASRSGGAGGGTVSAPMPGRVVKVLVEPGDVVAAGTPVIVVEAMKMENELCCDAPGVVQGIRVEAGQTVDSGEVLIELGPFDNDETPGAG